jgi:hypothetical protein
VAFKKIINNNSCDLVIGDVLNVGVAAVVNGQACVTVVVGAKRRLVRLRKERIVSLIAALKKMTANFAALQH